MKRVLLISYYFPPLGLAGSGRPAQLFRGLPEKGIDCHVLTVKPAAQPITFIIAWKKPK